MDDKEVKTGTEEEKNAQYEAQKRKRGNEDSPVKQNQEIKKKTKQKCPEDSKRKAADERTGYGQIPVIGSSQPRRNATIASERSKEQRKPRHYSTNR